MLLIYKFYLLINELCIAFYYLYIGKRPTGPGLQGIITAVKAEWPQVAINLGVPVGDVESFRADLSMGKINAMRYWGDGKCPNSPTTWEFLLETVEKTCGKEVRQELEKKVAKKPTWSTSSYSKYSEYIQ